MRFEQQSPPSLERQIVSLGDIDRHIAQARVMQSRETARLARRLFGSPARLLRRLRPGDRPASRAPRHV